MSSKICKYEKCGRVVNSPHDDKNCIFHAAKENKGLSIVDFNKLIFEDVSRARLNFKGYIFPGDISFSKIGGYKRIPTIANFQAATFFGVADFSNIEFEYDAIFFATIFKKSSIFSYSVFKKNALFVGAIFYKHAEFCDVQASAFFKFSGSQFRGGANFSESQFLGKVFFYGNRIGGPIYFENIVLGQNSNFYFQSPIFKGKKTKRKHKCSGIKVVFTRVSFIPFYSFFEEIKAERIVDIDKIIEKPILIFRYCELRDVYFMNNDMSLFSFYTSTFDQARFISSYWGKSPDSYMIGLYRRQNVIFEDQIFTYLRKNKIELRQINIIKEYYDIMDLKYDEIATLYRRMKASSDRTKDFPMAGWFYFNEFEMRRHALLKEGGEIRFSYNTLRRLGKYILYCVYKALAGYGEQSRKAVMWFANFTIAFTFIHMLSGLRIPDERHFNYDFSPSFHGFQRLLNHLESYEYWENVFYSLVFTLYRVIPINYLPYQRSELSPIGFDGLLWSFLNSVVLIIMVIFIIMGLRRHFRRY